MGTCLVSAATATDFEDAAEAVSSNVRELAAEPHLGILTLASALNRCGTYPQIVDLNRSYYDYLAHEGSGVKDFAEWAAGEIVTSEAEVYGFSSLCSSYPVTIRIAASVKRLQPDCTILLGGPQASVVDLRTLEAFPFIDFVLRGEADETLPLLIKELSEDGRFSTVPGLTYRGPFGPIRNPPAPVIEDLDSLPLPAYHLAAGLDSLPSVPLELGRGCPFSCTFCSTNDFFRRKFRLKSPQRVLADMRAIAAQFGARRFDLVHDMFTVDRRRVVAFCNHMIESGEGFAWECSARTDCVDEELLELMARAGCDGIFFGVETGSRRMQKIIEKDLDPDRAKVMIATAERLGISTTVALITGFPEENWSDLRETVDMYMHSMRHPRSKPQLNLLAPLAGTPVHSQYKDQMILEDLCSDMSHQGRIQNNADRNLIRKHPDIFSNFYLLPAPGLDRGSCLELREFLLMCSVRLRWLLTAVHQTSSHCLDIFLTWRKHRMEIRPDLNGGGLRHYYSRALSRNDFVYFVRERLSGAGNPAVEALLTYHEAYIEAERYDASIPRAGQLVSGAMLPGDIPVRKRHIHVFQLDWDVQSVIDSLKRVEQPTGLRKHKVYQTEVISESSMRLIEITPLLGRTLQLCDGHRNADECIAELQACFDCSDDLRACAAEYLLEHVHSHQLIELYRPAFQPHPIDNESRRNRQTTTIDASGSA
jgi:radical SAM superfamily enzyme YgiQ (UPF0313 family)